MHERLVHPFFRYHTFLYRILHINEKIAAVQVAAVSDRKRHRLFRTRRNAMSFMKIANRPTIGNYMSLKAPFFPQNILQQCFASAARFSVRTVIRSHDRFHFRFLHTGFKCRKVCLIHILLARLGIELMAQVFRTAMYRKMFRAGRCLHIVLIMSLYSFHEPHAESGCQVRVFPECLMASAPSRVSENIDVGRPERQPFVNIKIFIFLLCVELRPAFRGNGVSYFFQKIFVKCGRQRDCLRKYGRRSCSCHAVERLIPPVISFDAQSFYRRSAVHHLKSLLLQCHLCDQTAGAFFKFCIFDFVSYKFHSWSSCYSFCYSNRSGSTLID